MGLKEMFRGMDTDNSGTITIEELKQGLAKQGTKLTEQEVKQLMEAVSSLSFSKCCIRKQVLPNAITQTIFSTSAYYRQMPMAMEPLITMNSSQQQCT